MLNGSNAVGFILASFLKCMDTENSLQTSNELIHWLKMLSLPLWARVGLVVAMILALTGAFGMLVYGVMSKDSGVRSSSVVVLTIGMPVALIKEGYVLNPHGVKQTVDGKIQHGVVMIKVLDADFLLKATKRLYFAQDFAFFIRGLIEVQNDIKR